MKIKRQIIALPLVAVMLFAIPVNARENGANGNRQGNSSANRGNSQDQLQASCTPASAKTDLEINNVRTTIMTGGDMWWDLTTARYEVPKDGKAHSIFSGALWIGGLDAGGQLKVAAMTYRQTGNDFWPGPLDTTTVSIDLATCNQYDKHWKITKKEVEDYALYLQGLGEPGYTIPLVIQNWPGNGSASMGQGHYLAPFFDANGDGNYDYTAGDYPGFDLTGSGGCSKFQLFGDQVLWWVFNDKGNIHSETGAAAIGLEIHAQAFAFSTNDEINNMTFYTYKIINRSTVSMNNTYFGQWTDADLGAYDDDYVGCDVGRGLGYTYNGDANDGSSALPVLGTYGANPPAIGMDFFEGPLADPGDGIDNDHDGNLDEIGEQIIMSKFVYYNNDQSITGNPDNATHFYNYLSGFWKDGTPFTYDLNAYGGSQNADYMFPGTSDPTGIGTGGAILNGNWSEATVNNSPADRRMMQSAGPFTLQPGAVNYITVGAVWARAANGGPLASVELMRTTDDKAQRLFDNCFRTLDGPDAPDVTMQELDKELILYLTNKPSSNNYLESYAAGDPGIVYGSLHPALANIDTSFNFEGYQIFQLKDAAVSTADLYNLDKARLVAHYDLRNGVTTLVNREFNQALNADVPQDMTIEASDEGIEHSIKLTEDAFATGDRRMINHKTYYYMALSYAYNNYLTYNDVSFDTINPLNPSNIGQKKPYLAGRRNVKIYAGIPHIPNPEASGTNQNAIYGSGPKITRHEGSGNSNNVLDLTDASVNAILAAPAVTFNAADPYYTAWSGTAHVEQIEYMNGHGPINVKVIDPLNVPAGEFNLRIRDSLTSNPTLPATATWVLNQTSPVIRSWYSDTTTTMINLFANEQIIPELGLSITIAQAPFPGNSNNPDKNGYLESSLTFTDATKSWLSGVEDDDSHTETNWIRAGTTLGNDPNDPCATAWSDRFIGANAIDPEADFERMVNGTWAPYRLTANMQDPALANPCFVTGPAYWQTATMLQNRIDNIANVDVVFTNDRTKWTRVPVLEMGSNLALNYANAMTMWKRASPSVDKYGNVGDGFVTSDQNDADFISATGMGWFPGYAINVETGERLNMAFGENSALTSENGRDMLWNPTNNERSQFYDPLFGGQHYLYIFGHNGNERYGGVSPLNTPPYSSYSITALNGELKDVPAYDHGAMMMKILNLPAVTANYVERTEIFRDAMWVSIPLLSDEFADWQFNYAGNPLPTDAKVRLRVAKPYKRAITGVTPGATNKVWIPTDTIFTPQNNNRPLYSFNTYDLKTETNSNEAAVSALELINVVPNPYYAYSAYEKNQIENRVKFTNLPEKCTIRIYTVSGTLIRKLTKDSPITSLDWDLKNQAGIPIASGLYIVHVEVPGVGEKILKFFGVLRPVDLDAY
ncbi:MAG: T9SS C-terminal target domain-containing protein [Bacteroidota bacterium]|nr:T9SS C-terminal target domain-containing protein [Bacteroidota bacterium]